MRLKSLFVAAVTAIVCCSCREQPKEYSLFDDTMVSFRETQNFSVFTGRKGLYVLSGKFAVVGMKPRYAGEAVLLSGVTAFRLKGLLDRYPKLRENPDISAAEQEQERVIAKYLRKLNLNVKREISTVAGHAAP
jgi:hypothetical protein